MTTEKQDDLKEVALDSSAALKEKAEKEEEKVPDKGGLGRINRQYGANNGLILCGAYLCALCNGAVMPFFAVIFREILDFLNTWYVDNQAGIPYDLNKNAVRCLIYFLALGTAALIFTTLQYGFWGTYGSKVGIAVRQAYLRAVLRQDIAFHDKETAAKLNNAIVTDCQAIQDGVSVKMGFLVQQSGTFVVGLAWAFYYSWQLTLILMACVPVLMVVGWIQGKMIQGAAGAQVDPFSEKGGALSQEVLTNIRIVLAFPTLVRIKIEEYINALALATPTALKTHAATGLGIGFFMFALFGIMYPLTLYVGSGMVDKNVISIGEMFGAYFAFFIAGMGLGQIGSVLGDIRKSGIAANRMFVILDREPQIRPADGTPDTTKKITGKVEFKNVSFAYPSNPERMVLKNVSFKLESGKSLALVGPSGSGKSTVIALLERFFDPTEGEILIDDVLIHNYDVNHLRSQIGLVSQMPLLFDSTISENIRGGLTSKKQEDIENAAKLANAHEFIIKTLDKGYDTNVGELGGKLSGGQRQRIAIARAMLLNPSLLLLDEATSALDTKSEHEVQEALDKIKQEIKQTTVTIAHRLSTIQNSDNILVLVEGEVVEQGNHQELLRANGVYAILCQSQKLLEEKHTLHQQEREQSLIDMANPHSAEVVTNGHFPEVVPND